jgi:hypothetical protein
MERLEHWRGAGSDIEFEPEDFEVLELSLALIPEVRVCAQVLKWAREANLKYPVMSPAGLTTAMRRKTFTGGGHTLDAKGILTFMTSEYFPINDEGDLLSRSYMALLRCKAQAAQDNPQMPDTD